MRLPVTFALAVLVTPALAQMPPRKAGLWEEFITRRVSDGQDQTSLPVPYRISQYCIDAASEQEFNAMGSRLNPAMCTKLGSQRLGSAIISESTCKIGDATMRTQRIVSSSSDTTYTMILSTRREGGAPGASVESQMTIEAKWTGTCKDDQRPGDMIFPGGGKTNIRDIPRRGG